MFIEFWSVLSCVRSQELRWIAWISIESKGIRRLILFPICIQQRRRRKKKRTSRLDRIYLPEHWWIKRVFEQIEAKKCRRYILEVWANFVYLVLGSSKNVWHNLDEKQRRRYSSWRITIFSKFYIWSCSYVHMGSKLRIVHPWSCNA